MSKSVLHQTQLYLTWIKDFHNCYKNVTAMGSSKDQNLWIPRDVVTKDANLRKMQI